MWIPQGPPSGRAQAKAVDHRLHVFLLREASHKVSWCWAFATSRDTFSAAPRFRMCGLACQSQTVCVWKEWDHLHDDRWVFILVLTLASGVEGFPQHVCICMEQEVPCSLGEATLPREWMRAQVMRRGGGREACTWAWEQNSRTASGLLGTPREAWAGPLCHL